MGYRTYAGYKPYGTRLVRELINSAYLCKISVKRYIKTIGSTHRVESGDKSEYSVIEIDINYYTTQSPLYMGVAHELIHAYRNMIGVRSEFEQSYIYLANGIVYQNTVEELYTVGIYKLFDRRWILGHLLFLPVPVVFSQNYCSITENSLRLENDLPVREVYTGSLL